MGRIVKQVSEGSTRYYWYPGEKKEWIRAGVAIAAGAVVFGLLGLILDDWLIAATVATSVTAAIAGLNFGRRDARALAGFPDLNDRSARRAAIVHTGRAAWRGMVQGVGGAAAAVIIVNMSHSGFLADWLLPLVPAAVGALAHQAGMLYERVGAASPPAEATTVDEAAGTGTPAIT